MIKAALVMVARALLETALVLLAVGMVFAVLSFRVGRRLVTTREDPFERLSARASQLNALIPRRPVANEEEEMDD